MICPVLLQYPDEFILNTKVVRKRSTNPDTQPTRVSDVHDTLGLIFSPPDTLSGNHPEPIVHPRMNSRSEQRASYYVRASIAFILSCNIILCCACFVFFIPPLLLSGSPDDRCRCPCDRLRRRRPYPPTIELPGKQRHFPSPTYRLLVYIYLLH